MTESIAKPKILIVDDVAENLHLMMNILREDFAVIAATSGERALRVAGVSPVPELILLDIQMPDMDGFEVLRHLKRDPITEQIPVIFITALTDEGNEAEGLSLGAVDYITKPVNAAITLLRVHHQIKLKQAQRELEEHETMLRAITDAVQSAVLLIDDLGRIQFVNPAAEKLFGYGQGELMGLKAHETLTPESLREHARRWLEQFIRTGTERVLQEPLELAALCKDGSELPIELYVGRIRRGDHWWTVGSAIDITERKIREEHLLDLAETDPLTGARNRRSFMQLAEQVMKDRREGKDIPICYLMFDLDHFKRINDNYGHGIGDKVLCAFVDVCNANLRESDLFARIGGEEFAALIRSRNLDLVENIAERIRMAFYHGVEVEIDGETLLINTSVSIGLVEIGPKQESVDSALQQADTVLYQAKQQGRNRVVKG